MTDDNIACAVEKVRRLYALCAKLTREFKRPFTPDGHLVGSIGELFAAHIFGLELAPPSTEGYDATARDGRKVQIKATGGTRRVSLYSGAEHLIVLIIDNGKPKVVFNGPGKTAFSKAGKKQKNSQRQVSLAKLRKLMARIPEGKKLPEEQRI